MPRKQVYVDAHSSATHNSWRGTGERSLLWWQVGQRICVRWVVVYFPQFLSHHNKELRAET